MGPAEIIIIVAAVAIVVGAIIVYAVRKAKGKPAGCSGCGCCPYANQCSRNSASKADNYDSCCCHGDGISDSSESCKSCQTKKKSS